MFHAEKGLWVKIKREWVRDQKERQGRRVQVKYREIEGERESETVWAAEEETRRETPSVG